MLYVLDEKPEVYDLPVGPQMPAAATALNVGEWTGVGLGLLVGGGMLGAAMLARARMIEGKKEEESAED